MILAGILIAIVAAMAISLSSDGRDLNFSARDVQQTSRARFGRR